MPKPHLALLIALTVAYGVSRFSGQIDPYHLDVLIGIGINIILAVSLNLVNGYTGQFSLGHAGFMAVGAYMSAVMTMGLSLPLAEVATASGFKWAIGVVYNGFAHGVNFITAHVHALPEVPQFLVAAAIGGGFAAVAGYLIGKPSLRLKGDYLALVTLGFGEIIRVIFQNVDFVPAEPSYPEERIGGALGINGIPAHTDIGWVIAFVAVAVFVITCLVHSTYGRGFLATHDDEVASEAVGLNTTRYKIAAFVIGAFFAGTAGALYGHFKLTITPTGFDFTKSIEIVVMVILGGMGNTVGVILAAVLLTLLPEVLRSLGAFLTSILPDFLQADWLVSFLKSLPEYRMIIYSFLLIVLMLVRPQGLFNFGLRPSKKKTAPAMPAA